MRWTWPILLIAVAAAPAEERLINGDFEGGFVDGVAEGWAWFDTRQGARPAAATDEVHGGSFAQRLESPVATFDGERYAGLFQRVAVQPGATYTLTAWSRVPGEHLPDYPRVALLAVALDGDMGWGSEKDIRVEIADALVGWGSMSVTFAAREEQLTVWLVGWHKFSRGETGVWYFDDVSLQGPPGGPTHTPTITPTPSPTPTATPPARGDNLLFNGDFEQAFADGVAAGWKSWAVDGAPRWRENAKLGPMGAGVCGPFSSQGGPCECTRAILAMNAKWHLDIVTGAEYARAAKEQEPEILLIGRMFNDTDLGNNLPRMSDAELEAIAKRNADQCYEAFTVGGYPAQCWTDANEQNFNNAFHRSQYLKYALAFVRRCRQLGLRSCVFNMAVGNPTDPEVMLSDEVRAVLAEADYVGYHAYGPPGTDLMMASDVERHAFQWRKYARWYRERGWRMPPVLYTEGTTYGGWHGRFTPGQIGEDMVAFAAEIRRDPWAVAMTVFCMGDWSPGGAWNAWDISPFYDEILHPVGAFNAAHPVDAYDGRNAQQFESGETSIDGGIAQRFRVPEAGAYRIDAHVKWEWYPHPEFRGRPRPSLRLGVDPKGQLEDGEATSIKWSDDLIRRLRMDTDIWYHAQWLVTLPAGDATLWVRGTQLDPLPPVRFSIDAVSVRRSAR